MSCCQNWSTPCELLPKPHFAKDLLDVNVAVGIPSELFTEPALTMLLKRQWHVEGRLRR
jgi:hypothetical protein